MRMQRSLNIPDLFAPPGRRLDGLSDAALQIRSGCTRLLLEHGYSPMAEVPLKARKNAQGRRADLVGINGGGDLVIIEIKSGVADLRADQKWQDYLLFCDRFYFAVDQAFPRAKINDVMEDRCGLIIADRFGAGIVREATSVKLSAARRSTVTRAVALVGGRRLAPSLAVGRGSEDAP